MWVERVASYGYATKGFVYILVGILAILVIFTQGGKITGTSGALHTVAQQPYGQFLLILIAFGLVSYSFWRLVQAIKDPRNQGNDAKGLLTRGGYILSGIIYSTLAYEAIDIVFDFPGGNNEDSKEDWTARILLQPFGRWIVGIGGAMMIGVGFYRIYRALRVKFRKTLDLTELNEDQKTLVIQVCRVGILARGIIYILFGFFIIQAAYQFEANEVKGLDQLLQTIVIQPWGQLLLLLFALGLVAYGIYMEVKARYRNIDLN